VRKDKIKIGKGVFYKKNTDKVYESRVSKVFKEIYLHDWGMYGHKKYIETEYLLDNGDRIKSEQVLKCV